MLLLFESLVKSELDRQERLGAGRRRTATELLQQHRMHHVIATLISECFYARNVSGARRRVRARDSALLDHPSQAALRPYNEQVHLVGRDIAAALAGGSTNPGEYARGAHAAGFESTVDSFQGGEGLLRHRALRVASLRIARPEAIPARRNRNDRTGTRRPPGRDRRGVGTPDESRCLRRGGWGPRG